MSNVTAYGGVIYRGSVTDGSNVGPANSISFTSDGSNSFDSNIYNGTLKTLSSAWALIDTSSGISSVDDLPVFTVTASGVPTTLVPTYVNSLAAGSGAIIYYKNIPSTHLFRFSGRRTVNQTYKLNVDDASVIEAELINFQSSASMSASANFNVYSVGYQFTDGSATEIQFLNDNSEGAVNRVDDTVYQASDITNLFSTFADTFADNGVTYFNGRTYDDGNLRTNLETMFNLVMQKVPNALSVTDSVTIVGTLSVSTTGQPVSTVEITASPQVQYLDVLHDQNVTVNGVEYASLASFSKAGVANNEDMYNLRENFITSFVQHTIHYFDGLLVGGSSVYPTAEVNNFLVEYLKPIVKRARFFSMAAMTGTNVVPHSTETNTLYLKDIDQIWSSYAAMTLTGVANFESTMNAFHGLVNYERYLNHLKMYEYSLFANGLNWSHQASNQQPFMYSKKLLAIMGSVVGSQSDGIRKLLQVWNIARIHNNVYDNDANTGMTSVGTRQPGNNLPWDGSTVGDLQLALYVTYGYGPEYTWLSNATGFFAETSEPTGVSNTYIDQNLLDRVLVHLRLNEFAQDLLPSNVTDVYEKEGWTAFVDSFMRYYMWSATSSASAGSFTAEQTFIGKKAGFFRSYDASVSANTAFTLNDHILTAAQAVITNPVDASAFQRALSQVRSLNSATFWNDVVIRRLNHLPYHVVWHMTENMVAKPQGAGIVQDAAVLIATMNNLVEFYPRTTSADAAANSLVPSVYEWYKVVGYLSAIPQELPLDGTSTYSQEIAFLTSSRASYPFVDLQTQSPILFFSELTRRLFQFHVCDGTFTQLGALDSNHDQTNVFDPNSTVLGEYDPNTDKFTTGFRSWKNVNSYYQLLKKENDLRLAVSNQNSEYDLNDLMRIFESANTDLDSRITAVNETNTTVQSDIQNLENVIATYHDPYLGASSISDLQLRYVQISSENRAQSVLQTTYQVYGTLVSSVKTSSSSVSALQTTYQSKLNTYNSAFDAYLEKYSSWNTLLDQASALIESSTSYVDLLTARIQLTAQVSQLREKFNQDVIAVRAIVQGVQQTFLNLKSQGVRIIPTTSTTTTETIAGVTYTRRGTASVAIQDILNFVPL